MTINYTTNLALAQPVTGTESGAWGDDVNNGITAYLDISIAGGLSITVTTADVTLTNTQGSSSGTNISSTTAQYAILNVSGAMTADRNLIVPSSSKWYVINNSTTGGFVLTVKGSATTGVALVNSERALIAWNGSDYIKIANSLGPGTFTTLSGTTSVTTPIVKSASSLTLQTNGTTTAVTVDTSQNVGIGGATPASNPKVSLYGGIRFLSTEAATATYTGIGSLASDTVSISTSGSERMRVDTGGNVGIGTASPSKKFEVFATANSLQIESIVRNDQSGTGVAAVGFNVSASAASETTSTKAGIGLVRTNSYGVGGLTFYNNATSSAGDFTTTDEKMRITPQGGVSFGSTGTAYGTSGQVLTSQGNASPIWSSASSSGGPRAQLFTTTGAGQTFTIPTGVTSVKVTLQAGGGGGGGQNGCNTQTSGSGAVGGAGVQWFVGLTPGNTLTVNIAAGGGGGGTGANGSTGGAVSVASGTQTITTISATGGGGGVYAGANGSAGTGSGFTNGGSGGAGFTLIAGTYWNPLNRGMGGAGATPGSGPSGGTNGGVLFEY
jgi:hypothetical protein